MMIKGVHKNYISVKDMTYVEVSLLDKNSIPIIHYSSIQSKGIKILAGNILSNFLI